MTAKPEHVLKVNEKKNHFTDVIGPQLSYFGENTLYAL